MSDGGSLPDLTDRQSEVIAQLPASKHDIAEHLGISPNTVKSHFEAIRGHGVDVEYDRDAGQWFLADERSAQLRRLSTRHKQSITREATDIIADERATLMRRLRRTEPLKADPLEDPRRETFCAVLGDTHFGDVVEKEYWSDADGEYVTSRVYGPRIAAERVARFGEKALAIKEKMASVAGGFDDCYLFLLGDIATGMHVYEGQWQDITIPLNEQVEESVSALYQLIVSLADAFNTVQVRGVPGNHGTDKPSAAIGANTDLLTYSWVDDRLRDSGYSNVDFRTSEAHRYLNTTVRDWRAHVRHGDDEKEHVDETAASSRDWRGLVDEFDFHLAMKGHHHSPAFHKVMNRYPVFSAPSPKPGGEFPSKIGKPDVSKHADLGYVFGTSDVRPVTWQFLLDDR
jgi:DNA-binding transcriptional regulator YhcF (GntR family)